MTTTRGPGVPRFFIGSALAAAPEAGAPGAEFDLPAGAAQHVRVRRLQPGDALALFDGLGHEWGAQVLALTRLEVRVRLGSAPLPPAAAELPWRVALAFGVPANERADALVEKATELGAAVLQPLMCERSVLRLAGERAERRRAHWQAVAVAASEQCGRATVPQVLPVQELVPFLAGGLRGPQEDDIGGARTAATQRWLLSTDPAAPALAAGWRHPSVEVAAPAAPVVSAPAGRAAAATRPAGADAARALPWPDVLLLSGPEGGFSAQEEASALAAGFEAVSLGPRILRADTAPLAALAALAWLALASSAAHASRNPVAST